MTDHGDRVAARYQGRCWRCRRTVLESVELRLDWRGGRPGLWGFDSPDETTGFNGSTPSPRTVDPELAERRRRQAALFAAEDPGMIRHVRRYLEPE